MSCRQSKKVTRSRSLPGKSLAMATSNFVFAVTPCCSAWTRACSTEFGMKVVADEGRFRERLRHDDRRKPVPATDVGDRRAAFELRNDAVQRRQPGRDEIVVIAGPEEAARRAEQTLRLIAPADALAGAKRGLDHRLVLHHDHREIEGALQIDGTVRRPRTPSPVRAAR